MNVKEMLLNTKLKDDATEVGGISHSQETLVEFMETTEIPENAMLGTINIALKDSGILPINLFNYPELFGYTFDDLTPYIESNYDYINNFNYNKQGKNEEHELTFIEEFIKENIEMNTVEFPNEFGKVVKSNRGLELESTVSF
ncbi:hypothetical protein [Staphylococcus equorum]|uniref:Uncharacterized protein n=1 Tax=Staphylococcus equorum TaxID=246432 RepID=A0AAP7IGE0_9STAP|nr:hypothetical protein [Staphylococcus equorum]OEK58913.1 hypothetical protein ASS94_00900 [Staphylococcus equorum]